MAVSIVSKAGDGELSDYLVNRTVRAKPGSPPHNIEVSQANLANAIKVSWREPRKPNGPISKYEISYGYKDHKNHYNEKKATSTANTINLEGLAYYADYDIRARACSKLPENTDLVCGPWGAKQHKTGIGRKYKFDVQFGSH